MVGTQPVPPRAVRAERGMDERAKAQRAEQAVAGMALAPGIWAWPVCSDPRLLKAADFPEVAPPSRVEQRDA